MSSLIHCVSRHIKKVILHTHAHLSLQTVAGRNRQLVEAIEKVKDTSFVLKYYHIAKKRKSSSFQHCAIEQTALTISDKRYVTIAIEGDRPVDITRVLQTQVSYNGQLQSLDELLTNKSGATPQGYPEFVMKLHEMTTEQQDTVDT